MASIGSYFVSKAGDSSAPGGVASSLSCEEKLEDASKLPSADSSSERSSFFPQHGQNLKSGSKLIPQYGQNLKGILQNETHTYHLFIQTMLFITSTVFLLGIVIIKLFFK